MVRIKVVVVFPERIERIMSFLRRFNPWLSSISQTVGSNAFYLTCDDCFEKLLDPLVDYMYREAGMALAVSEPCMSNVDVCEMNRLLQHSTKLFKDECIVVGYYMSVQRIYRCIGIMASDQGRRELIERRCIGVIRKHAETLMMCPKKRLLLTVVKNVLAEFIPPPYDRILLLTSNNFQIPC